MTKSNSSAKKENGDKIGKIGKIGRILFIDLPIFVIFVIQLAWFTSFIFSIPILIKLFANIVSAQDHFSFIVALASLIEFGLFMSLLFIVSLGLYKSILKPFLTKNTGKDIKLEQIQADLTEQVSRPFFSIIISIFAIYMLMIATEIVKRFLTSADADVHYGVISLLSIAIVAVIISIIMRIEK